MAAEQNGEGAFPPPKRPCVGVGGRPSHDQRPQVRGGKRGEQKRKQLLLMTEALGHLVNQHGHGLEPGERKLVMHCILQRVHATIQGTKGLLLEEFESNAMCRDVSEMLGVGVETVRTMWREWREYALRESAEQHPPETTSSTLHSGKSTEGTPTVNPSSPPTNTNPPPLSSP
jgi:hypothetical protein